MEAYIRTAGAFAQRCVRTEFVRISDLELGCLWALNEDSHEKCKVMPGNKAVC
jgi:hypothetical protein